MRLGMIRVTTTTSPDPGYLDRDGRRIRTSSGVFLDDISCVSFIYGEQSVVRFVRAVQRMSRARGVVVRERVFSSSTTTTATNGGGNERSSSRRSRRRRSGRSAASDVLANDASCSCAMTLSRQSNGSIRSNAGSGRKTLFTAEAKRGATRKTRETDVVQFVKVPSGSSSGTTTNQCIALEYTSIDDALRNEKDIQKARERSNGKIDGQTQQVFHAQFRHQRGERKPTRTRRQTQRQTRVPTRRRNDSNK